MKRPSLSLAKALLLILAGASLVGASPAFAIDFGDLGTLASSCSADGVCHAYASSQSVSSSGVQTALNSTPSAQCKTDLTNFITDFDNDGGGNTEECESAWDDYDS